MNHLKLITGAWGTDGLRWARENLYALLVLTPLVLGMTYFGVGRIVGDAEWRPTETQVVAASVVAAACLLAMSLSRASVEIFHLRRPEWVLDALPVSADAQLWSALLRRVVRTTTVAVAALVLRGLAGGDVWDARALVALALFVCVASAGEILGALQWIHWGHRRGGAQAVAGLAAFAAGASSSGLLLASALLPGGLTIVNAGAVYAASGALALVLAWLAFSLHRKWRAGDAEFAKRLAERDRWGSWVERFARRVSGGRRSVESQLARDLRLTLRGFSSAVYVAASVAALALVLLVAVLTTGVLPSVEAEGFFAMTLLPGALAVKFACALSSAALSSVVPALVAHQRPHLWLERSVGLTGAEASRAKLYLARVVTLPAAVAAWAVGAAFGAVPVVYALPLLAECLWLWWLVATLAGGLAYEMPEQPGLSLILTECAALAAGGFSAALWPMGLAVYGLAGTHILMRGEQRAHLHFKGEGA